MNNLNFDSLLNNYPSLAVCRSDVEAAVGLLTKSYEDGGKLLLCGNGGSCADCEHISGELLKGFLSKRPLCGEIKKKITEEAGTELAEALQLGLPALPLTSFTALSTAYANDVSAEYVYAQLTLALGEPGDVLLGISTSGKAKNVRAAFSTARAIGLKTIALTGKKGVGLRELCDCVIAVPEEETYRVQELHLPVYHFICAELERRFFG